VIYAAFLFRHGLPLGIVLRGLIGGGVLALSAAGVVLVYRIDRVVNFAQAGFGAVAAVCAVGLTTEFGWPWLVTFPVGLLAGALFGGLMSVGVVDRMRARPRLAVTVATIGLAEVLAGATALLASAMPGQPPKRDFGFPLHLTLHSGPVLFHSDAFLAVAIVVAGIVGLELWLRSTATGLAFRAATDAGERARLAGMPVGALSALAWGLAGLLASVAAMLHAPLAGVTATAALAPAGPANLLRVLSAAVLGGMSNLRRTVAAAVAIGLLDEVSSWTYGRTIYVDMLLVAAVVVTLLFSREATSRRRRSSGSELATREARPLSPALRATRQWRGIRGAGIAVVLVGAVTVPLWARPSQSHAAGVICVYATLALSLLVLTGWAGQVSLGQFALAGLGGGVTALLYGRHGWDITLALAAGVAVAAVAAVLLGLPALRLSGPFFAVTTLGFAVVAASYLLVHRFVPWFVQEHIERPVLWKRVSLSSEGAMYEACLVALLIAVLAVTNLRRGRIGRAVIAVRENEASAAATGIHPARTKLIGFAVAGGLAGLAGGMYVVLQQGLQVDSYSAEASLRIFAIVVVGGLVSVGGVILGAVAIRGTELLFPSAWALLASGLGITALVALFPDGLAGVLNRGRDELAGRLMKARE
jgi:ABC-type branched-subunit amino acid transport system permease subunit